ncbi:hypothetical protein BC629DRAFT_1499706 [Irpex lacteus]|nr:hypothetical protein BC629DRAFT_1499706 [Irpex lacteus]
MHSGTQLGRSSGPTQRTRSPSLPRFSLSFFIFTSFWFRWRARGPSVGPLTVLFYFIRLISSLTTSVRLLTIISTWLPTGRVGCVGTSVPCCTTEAVYVHRPCAHAYVRGVGITRSTCLMLETDLRKLRRSC